MTAPTSGHPIVIGSGATLNVTGTGDADMAAGGKHLATLTLVYDETPAQIRTSCMSKSGLKTLHFGSILDHKVLWSPVNGPSTFELSD